MDGVFYAEIDKQGLSLYARFFTYYHGYRHF